ncbi:MAG TPA: anti-sigma factor [Mycobacteriales bacterium]|nr:anti-sigma factor [Mycobacteriales bacterium]
MTEHADNHEHWQELLAGHALSALDPDDEADLVAHLEECGDCRAELADHALTAAHLAALADDEAGAVPNWSQIRGEVVGPETPVTQLAAGTRRHRFAQRTLAAAAVITVIAGGTVAGWQVFSSGGSHRQHTAAVGCAAVSPCEEIALRSSNGVRRATVIVAGGVARLQPAAMGRPGAGRTFVLWQLPRGGAPIPLTEFMSASSTSGSSPLSVPLSQTTAFAVSSERADVHPTSPTRVLAIGGVTT